MTFHRTHAVYPLVLAAYIIFADGTAPASAINPHGAVDVWSLPGGDNGSMESRRVEGDPAFLQQAGYSTGNRFQSSEAWASADAAADRFLQTAAGATGDSMELFVPVGQGRGTAFWRDIATTDATTKPNWLRLNFSLSSFLSAESYTVTNDARVFAEIAVYLENGWQYGPGLPTVFGGDATLAGRVLQWGTNFGIGVVEGTVFDPFVYKRVDAHWDSYSFSPVPGSSKYLFDSTFHTYVPYSSEYGGYRWGLTLSAYTYAKGGEAFVYEPGPGMPAGLKLESISNRDIGPPLRVYFDSGLLPIDVPGFVVLNISSGTQTQAEAGYAMLSGSIPLAKTGAGTLVLTSANTITGSATVQSGQLTLAHQGALGASHLVPLSGAKVDLAPGLQTAIGGMSPNAGGLTDVGNGLITVMSGLSASDAISAIVAGRGDGSWAGTSGITSSAAASSDGSRTVGWIDNGDGSLAFGYAASGDANLDWQIDIIDIANVLSGGKVNSGLAATWAEGDFNYDGFADILDIADFMSSGLFNAGPYNAPAGNIAAVPEPSTYAMALAGLACGGFSMWRRRKRA